MGKMTKEESGELVELFHAAVMAKSEADAETSRTQEKEEKENRPWAQRNQNWIRWALGAAAVAFFFVVTYWNRLETAAAVNEVTTHSYRNGTDKRIDGVEAHVGEVQKEVKNVKKQVTAVQDDVDDIGEGVEAIGELLLEQQAQPAPRSRSRSGSSRPRASAAPRDPELRLKTYLDNAAAKK